MINDKKGNFTAYGSLRVHQKQIDEDGTEVGVSRQALEELLDDYAQIKAGIAAKKGCCSWNADEEGNWETDCHNLHILIDGSPVDNGMEFCCYCGNKLMTKDKP
jgi:hypothetical protein